MGSARADGLVILGNQLFPPDRLIEALSAVTDAPTAVPVLMVEDEGICQRWRHHKQRLTMVLAAMRGHRDALRESGFTVPYAMLADSDEEAAQAAGFETHLRDFVERHGVTRVWCWEIPGRAMEARMQGFCDSLGIELCFLASPMFLTPRDWLDGYFESHASSMAPFYQAQRKRLGVMLTEEGKPQGGQWSFDGDNRKALPADVTLPGFVAPEPNPHTRRVAKLVAERFSDNPGQGGVDAFWLPTTRAQALSVLDRFLEDRFACFGPYEDALSQRDPVLFHSVLSPALNLGLLTPDEVLSRALQRAEAGDIPINSLEGFVRQLVGWREFIHGVYRTYGREQSTRNHFGHQRKLTDHWYAGTTGLTPLDDVIRKAQRWGWTHHIERLMVAGNLMLLCEIAPVEAHRWFMEMFVDASAWVMGPNVYGMALFSDGGIFATKPYICGSNYILKMSDYKKPRGDDSGAPSWCDVMDGLYWRFIGKHREFFAEQARLAYAVRTLERMNGERKRRIFDAAEGFLERVTA